MGYVIGNVNVGLEYSEVKQYLQMISTLWRNVLRT
jgi:hypothetical protein